MVNSSEKQNNGTVKRKASNDKIAKSNKIWGSKNNKGGEGDFVDALKCGQLENYIPSGRSFTNCNLRDVQEYYLRVIREIFGFRASFFLKKENLKKKIEEMNFDNQNLLEIINFLKDFQNEI